MQDKDNYELILNHLTAGESIRTKQGQGFEDYKQMAYLFLNRKGKSFTEEDILNQFSASKTLEDIFSYDPDRFIPATNVQKGNERVKAWHDIMGIDVIESGDPFFDYFFIIKLRHIDLLEIDDYLDYHLENSFENDTQKFVRFLNLSVCKYEGTLLQSTIIDTIKEWIQMSEKTQDGETEGKTEKIKGRIGREAGDRLTSLSLTQTALLTQFLQEERIILKGDDLTYTQAGKALYILTGYSSHTLRQQLGTRGESSGVKYQDYKELHEANLKLAERISTHIRKK